MPIITVQLAKGRTAEQKQHFVEAITKEVAKTLQVKEEWITVLFNECDRGNWASNGELHCLKFGDGYGKKEPNKNSSDEGHCCFLPFYYEFG